MTNCSCGSVMHCYKWLPLKFCIDCNNSRNLVQPKKMVGKHSNNLFFFFSFLKVVVGGRGQKKEEKLWCDSHVIKWIWFFLVLTINFSHIKKKEKKRKTVAFLKTCYVLVFGRLRVPNIEYDKAEILFFHFVFLLYCLFIPFLPPPSFPSSLSLPPIPLSSFHLPIGRQPIDYNI